MHPLASRPFGTSLIMKQVLVAIKKSNLLIYARVTCGRTSLLSTRQVTNKSLPPKTLYLSNDAISERITLAHSPLTVHHASSHVRSVSFFFSISTNSHESSAAAAATAAAASTAAAGVVVVRDALAAGVSSMGTSSSGLKGYVKSFKRVRWCRTVSTMFLQKCAAVPPWQTRGMTGGVCCNSWKKSLWCEN